MDIFEKAHTSNLWHINKSKLIHKKKQFKKMLVGYKTNNPNAIKNSEFTNTDQELNSSLFSEVESEPNIKEVEDVHSTQGDIVNSVTCKSYFEPEFHIPLDIDSEVKKASDRFNRVTALETSKFQTKKKTSSKKKCKETEKSGNSYAIEKNNANITKSSQECRSASPICVSVTRTNMDHCNLSDVFNDYPTIGTEAFLLRPILSAPSDINSGTEIFAKRKFKRRKVKCTEPLDIDMSTINDISKVNISNNYENSSCKAEKQQFEKAIDLTQDSMISEASGIIMSPYKTYKVRDGCIVVLRNKVEIYLHGRIKIQALGGTTEILGYKLTPMCSVEIYAPNNSYAHVLKTLENCNDYYGLFGKLTALGLSVIDTEDIVTSLGPYDGVLYFQMLVTKKIDFVNNVYRNSLFHCADMGKNICGCTLYSEIPRKCFYENPVWANVSNNSAGMLRGVVCGGKGAGKSTFLKYFVNRQLSYGPVLVIDLDPGQCEFTVAGNISVTVVKEPIIGPNYTHLQTPDRMLHIGMINVMDNLQRYINAISELIAFCKETKAYEELPWIVNTMGMCNAVGLKLMLFIILSIRPTFLFQLDSVALKKRFEFDLNPENVKRLHSNEFRNDPLLSRFRVHDLDYNFTMHNEETASTELKSSVSPSDERYFNFLAYFGELLDIDRSAVSLLGILPYVAPLKSLYIGTNRKICESLISKVINGKTVAMCHYKPPDISNKVFTLACEPLLCLGHGLVRGIDRDEGLLYVLTPLPKHQLTQVTCIVYSDWAPEIPSDEQTLAPGALVPYRALPLHSQLELMKTPRRRFNPLQLLRMSKGS